MEMRQTNRRKLIMGVGAVCLLLCGAIVVVEHQHASGLAAHVKLRSLWSSDEREAVPPRADGRVGDNNVARRGEYEGRFYPPRVLEPAAPAAPAAPVIPELAALAPVTVSAAPAQLQQEAVDNVPDAILPGGNHEGPEPVARGDGDLLFDDLQDPDDGAVAGDVVDQSQAEETPAMSGSALEGGNVNAPVGNGNPAGAEKHNNSGGASTDAFDVVLYRVIGNDLPPRHQYGQVYTNIKFILENEQNFPGWNKRWVINRVANQTEYTKVPLIDTVLAFNCGANNRAQIRVLLDKHGYTGSAVVDIPFDWDRYARAEFNYDDFPSPDYFETVSFSSMHPETKNMAIDHLYHNKNLYAINNNGARNAALRDGRQTAAKWILPFDGNCFITQDVYDKLNRGFREYESGKVKYLLVYMARLLDNSFLLDPNYRPQEAREEPQIVFRYDARDDFDENFRYGRRPKVEFLWRLKVPGPWDKWPKSIGSWEPLPQLKLVEPDVKYRAVGYVFRLFSGSLKQEASSADGSRDRWNMRRVGTESYLDYLDTLHFRSTLPSKKLATFDEKVMERERALYVANSADDKLLIAHVTSLLDEATKSLSSPLFSVMDKSVLPPSQNKHDYLSVRPYITMGMRADDTKLYGEGSDKFDRTRIQNMFQNVTVLALGWFYSGNDTFAHHGANMLRRFFIDPATRMAPNLNFAQASRATEHGNQKCEFYTGIIEFKDVYFVLDAVRLVHRSGALTKSEFAVIQQWCRALLTWLTTSTCGRAAHNSLSKHATFYNIQIIALALFVEDYVQVLSASRALKKNFPLHFNENGEQPLESKQVLSFHQYAFNLQGWVIASRMLRPALNLFQFSSFRKSLSAAFSFYLRYRFEPWPKKQLIPVDLARLDELIVYTQMNYPDVYAQLQTLATDNNLQLPRSPYDVKNYFHPDAGIHIFQVLGRKY